MEIDGAGPGCLIVIGILVLALLVVGVGLVVDRFEDGATERAQAAAAVERERTEQKELRYQYQLQSERDFVLSLAAFTHSPTIIIIGGVMAFLLIMLMLGRLGND